MMISGRERLLIVPESYDIIDRFEASKRKKEAYFKVIDA